ncbi:MAG: DUF6712 family protein [Bacteroidota bacterium]
MATYIYATDDDFHRHLGKAVSDNLSISQLAPMILGAAEKYIIPWVGQTLWDNLVSGVDDEDLTPEETILLPYVQRSLAWFTIHEYRNVGEVTVSDVGYMRQETETQKTAYQNQVNNHSRYSIEIAYQALEVMLTHMESATAGTYTDWEGTDENARNREAFINTARDFQIAYSTRISRFVMETMRGLMIDVEEFSMVPLLGTPFFEELKTAIDDKTVTAVQKTLIKKVQKAIAAFTVEEGIRRSIVRNTGQSIVTVEALESQSSYKEGVPSDNKLNLALRHNDDWGARHINNIKTFIDDNRNDYPTYKTWIEAIEAAAEEEEEESSTTTTYRNGCTTTTNKNQKSIIRF